MSRLNGGSVALAVVFAIFPLLPSGPAYLGLDATNAPDIAVLAVLVVWLMVRLSSERASTASSDPAERARLLAAWALFFAASTGAAIVGLAANNRVGSPIFDTYASTFLLRAVRSLDITTDPFHPVRVWLSVAEGFLIFVAVSDCARRASDPRRFVDVCAAGWLTGLAVVSTFAIVQYVTRYQLQPFWVLLNPALTRAHATLDDPNALGSYLVLGLGMAVGIALAARGSRSRTIAIALAVLAAAALVTTVSRIALVAAPLAALIVAACAPSASAASSELLISRRQRGIARWLLGGLAAATVLVIAVKVTVPERPIAKPANPAAVVARTVDPLVPLDESFGSRATLWSAALRMTRQHPITGVGLGRYPRLAHEFWSRWIPLDHPHNFFLQVLAETGIVGAAAFVAMLAVAIAAPLAAMRSADPRRAGFAAGTAGGAIAFVITLATGHPLLLPSGQFLWASFLAIGSPLILSLSKDERPSPRALGLAAAVVICVYSVAAWRTPAPPLVGSPWGYAQGLFRVEAGLFPISWGLPEEADMTTVREPGVHGAHFRWTGTRALLELALPPRADACVLQFASALPTYGGPQFVRVAYGDQQRILKIQTSDLNTIRLPIPADALDAEHRLLLHIDVDPPFVPAATGVSADARQLGIQLFPIHCVGSSAP